MTNLVTRLREFPGGVGAEALCREAAAEIELLRAALKVGRQALLEFTHAQECGPEWYTRGESGMYAQVRMWMRRGREAMAEALGPYNENGEFLKELPASADEPKPDAGKRPCCTGMHRLGPGEECQCTVPHP